MTVHSKKTTGLAGGTDGLDFSRKKFPVTINAGLANRKKITGRIFTMKDKDIQSLEHTKWRCQYHIVFAPKYRRMVIYGELKKDIGWILRKLCEDKGVEII